MIVKKKDGQNTKTYTVRLYDDLSDRIEQFADEDGRSINSEVVELLQKGIELMVAERRHLGSIDPVVLTKSNKEEQESKHDYASGDDTDSDEDKKNKQNRELA